MTPRTSTSYLTDNYVAVAEALGLGLSDLATLAEASFEASFWIKTPRMRASPRCARTLHRTAWSNRTPVRFLADSVLASDSTPVRRRSR